MCHDCGSKFWSTLAFACVIVVCGVCFTITIVRWQHAPVTNCYGHWSEPIKTSANTATSFNIIDRCETN